MPLAYCTSHAASCSVSLISHPTDVLPLAITPRREAGERPTVRGILAPIVCLLPAAYRTVPRATACGANLAKHRRLGSASRRDSE
ncbi:hypothetical protein EVG20_g5641 [Dentipellis fragilis]|uniref:Uncharacterized protein n=1 Tax=Dentipellis fragilis TaxID=205917 RepID=A0A4Y9YU75_9AGAM|nr:hypothetical protein EVG20_g5641 [Dentipellis fragilis]